MPYQDWLRVAAGLLDAGLQAGERVRAERGFMTIRPTGGPYRRWVEQSRSHAAVELLELGLQFLKFGTHGDHAAVHGQHLTRRGPGHRRWATFVGLWRLITAGRAQASGGRENAIADAHVLPRLNRCARVHRAWKLCFHASARRAGLPRLDHRLFHEIDHLAVRIDDSMVGRG